MVIQKKENKSRGPKNTDTCPRDAKSFGLENSA